MHAHSPHPLATSCTPGPPAAPPCVVTEYCSRGSLNDVLRAAKNSSAKTAQLDWPRRLNMMLDAAKGMVRVFFGL